MGYNSVEEYVDKAESNRNNAVLRALMNNSGGGGDSNILFVHKSWDSTLQSDVLDKTWQEIEDADLAVIIIDYGGSASFEYIVNIYEEYIDEDDPTQSTPYEIYTISNEGTNKYICDRASDYPVLSSNTGSQYIMCNITTNVLSDTYEDIKDMVARRPMFIKMGEDTFPITGFEHYTEDNVEKYCIYCVGVNRYLEPHGIRFTADSPASYPVLDN